MFKISTLALALLASSAHAADFDWNITEYAEPDFIDVVFSDARGGDEIKLKYYANDKTTKVQVFDYDNCNTTDSQANAITTPESPAVDGTGTLEVALDFNQTSISTSDFYTTEGDNDETGVIKFCVRIDLTADLDNNVTTPQESINFHESKLLIEVDMTEGFEVTAVETDRTAATQTNESAELDYNVLAFEVDESAAEIASGDTVYAQGSYLTVGIITNSTSGVKVAEIIQMNITGNTNFDSITSGTPSALTEKTCGVTIDPLVGDNAEGCTVKTMLVSDFFDTADPQDLTVKGVAVMQFAGARRLSSINARGLQEASTADDTFGLTVSLKPMDMGEDNVDNNVEIDGMVDSAAPASTVAGMMSVVVALFSFFLL